MPFHSISFSLYYSFLYVAFNSLTGAQSYAFHGTLLCCRLCFATTQVLENIEAKVDVGIYIYIHT